jgi:receptor protein-tyrosine kinase
LRDTGEPSDRSPSRTRHIGRILVEAGRLSAADADRVLRAQQGQSVPFGEAAIRMGYITQADVDYALARQFAFPTVAVGDPSLAAELIAAHSPNHLVAEQIRGLRTVIESRATANGRRHPMAAVVSADRGDGRSFIAGNLAVAFAQLGHRTLLIDANMREPAQHRIFRLKNATGLSTMLAGRSGVECVQRVQALPRLYVMPAGPTPPNPLELLERPAFRQLLSSADHSFRVVIIDTPAGSVSADAELIAGRAASAIVVSRADITRASTAVAFVRGLRAASVHVLGAVLNDTRPK